MMESSDASDIPLFTGATPLANAAILFAKILPLVGLGTPLASSSGLLLTALGIAVSLGSDAWPLLSAPSDC